MDNLIMWMDDPAAAGNTELGGKFGSLAEMISAGFQVPPGFGITVAAYRRFMRDADLEDRASAVRQASLGADIAQIEELSAEMATAISEAPLPPELEQAIREAYAELEQRTGQVGVSVAVRSSGESEDLAGASFAGQYDTFLWVSGADEVLSHVRLCWAGMFGAAVLTYRPTGDEELADFGMCVGIQQMVRSRSAGVMFTLDPVTGDRSKVVIESCWGLGEGVVSGAITPSRFVIDKVTFEQVQAVVTTQEKMFALDTLLGVVGLVDVQSELQSQACIGPDEITALAQLAKHIEQGRGAPQDIEWAVADTGEIRVLQVRPETVWSSRPVERIATEGTSAINQVLARFAGIKVARDEGPTSA